MPTDARTAHQQLSATAVSVLFSSKATLAKSHATTDSLHSDQFVSDAQLVALSALITSSATTALTTSTCTRVTATESALPEQSVTAALATGFADLAMSPARLALTILLTAPAASTEWATSRLQLKLNLVFLHVLTAPLQAKESVKFATSDVLLASDQPPTASLALLVKSSTKEAAGLPAPPFRCRQSVKMHPALISAPMASTNYQ